MEETWLYHYDPRQSNNQCSGGIAAHSDQNIPSAKFIRNIPRFNFFRIEAASYSLIILQKAKLSTQSVSHACWCIWRQFWSENSSGSSRRWFWSYASMSLLAGHLQCKRIWPTCASSILITQTILRIWPRRTTTCSQDWRNNWTLVIFLPKPNSLQPRGLGWTDKLLIFLSGLQKLEQSAKKCTELRVEYVEHIPSLFAVDIFLLVRVTVLSAPPFILTLFWKIHWTLCNS